MKPRHLLLPLLFLLACRFPTAIVPAELEETGRPAAATPLVLGEAPTGPLVGQPLTLPPAGPAPLFAPFEPIPVVLPAQMPRYAIRLQAVVNPAALPLLSEEQRVRLERDGFVLMDDRLGSPAALFEQAARRGQPFFIGSEWIVLEAAAVHQAVWRESEIVFLEPRLGRLLSALVDGSAGQRLEALSAEVPNPLVIEAARRNQAYFTIAARLVNPEFPTDPAVLELVQSELDLILLGGTFLSPYAGREMDYAPLGAGATRLDRALGWLTRVPFPIDPGSREARTWGQQLLLLGELLNQPEPAELWETLAVTLAYRDGDLNNRAAWQALFALQPPLDTLVLTAGRFANPSFALLPLPDRPDDRVYTGLTYNRVGLLEPGTPLPPAGAVTAAGPVRLHPRPYDLAAAFGSEIALDRLQTDGETAFASFDSQLAELRALLSAPDPEIRTRSFRDGWLYALEPLLETSGPARPPAWENPAWRMHRLDGWIVGAVGSLRTTGLIPVDGEPSPQPAADPRAGHTLDPRPELYSRLAGLTYQLRDGLAARGNLTVVGASQLDELAGRLVMLQGISQKLLGGQGLTPAEAAVLAAYPARLAGLNFPASWPLVFGPDGQPRRLLSLAAVRPLLVIHLYEGRQMVAVGAAVEWNESSP